MDILTDEQLIQLDNELMCDAEYRALYDRRGNLSHKESVELQLKNDRYKAKAQRDLTLSQCKGVSGEEAFQIITKHSVGKEYGKVMKSTEAKSLAHEIYLACRKSGEQVRKDIYTELDGEACIKFLKATADGDTAEMSIWTKVRCFIADLKSRYGIGG
jgi:hypothetical protein